MFAHSVKTIADLRSFAAEACGSATEVLGKFQKQAETSPVYAFEWSGSAIEASARWEVYQRIFAQIVQWEGQPDGVRLSEEKAMAAFAKQARREVIRLGQSITNRSTSPMANLMNDNRLKVWCELFEMLSDD
jgi:hypothetical protein